MVIVAFGRGWKLSEKKKWILIAAWKCDGYMNYVALNIFMFVFLLDSLCVFPPKTIQFIENKKIFRNSFVNRIQIVRIDSDLIGRLFDGERSREIMDSFPVWNGKLFSFRTVILWELLFILNPNCFVFYSHLRKPRKKRTHTTLTYCQSNLRRWS